MISFPPAKINLGLWITHRLPDGYHALQTCMAPIDWCDILEIVPARDGHTRLYLSGLDIDAPAENNLSMRAWQLLNKQHAVGPVEIYLHKNIPSGAGLGGGSSDAAHTLRLLNDLFDLQLGEKQLMQYAATLGADCPFFIQNQAVIATGKGELLEPFDLPFGSLYVRVIKPGFAISTPEAYRGVVPHARKQDIRTCLRQPVQQWKSILANDFEPSLFGEYPVLSQLKTMLYAQGAVYASLSGSGSAVYGLYDSHPDFEVPKGCRVHDGLLRGKPQ